MSEIEYSIDVQKLFLEMMLFLILEHILILLELVELRLPFQVLEQMDRREIMVQIVQ